MSNQEFKELSNQETMRARLLLEFLQVTKDGLVKPFDPTPVIRKLRDLERQQGVNIKPLMDCCPPVAEIHDVKDFKPYIMGAVRQFAQIMDIEPVDNSN